MLVPILIISALFIAIAFIVNENNAKYLLSGYNTMSDVERQNFDIKSFIPYFRNFHIFLGITLLLFSLLIRYFVNSDWSGIFFGIYPILAYVFFIWKSNQFTKNKSKKQIITTYVAMVVLLLLIIFVFYEFNNGLKDNEIIVSPKKIEITGDYGLEIKITDLKSVELVKQLPKISSKTNGFELEIIKKGYFRTESDEKVKLLINSKKTPIILLITNDNQRIYYSSKEKSNVELYNEVKRRIANK